MTTTSQFDFSNVKAREVQPLRTADYIVSELSMLPKGAEQPTSPVLTGRHAGDRNQKLKRARALWSAKRGRQRATMTDEERGKLAFEEARELWPECVFTGWENVCDAQGNPVEFSVDACRALLEAMPEWILGRLYLYFVNPDHFAGEHVLTETEIKETAGN